MRLWNTSMCYCHHPHGVMPPASESSMTLRSWTAMPISPCSFRCNSLRIQHRAHRSFHWLLVAVLTMALKCLLAGKLEITKDLAHWSLWSLHIALADPEKRDVTPRLGLSNSALSVLPKFQSQRQFQHTCPITAVDSALGCVRLRKPGTQMSC